MLYANPHIFVGGVHANSMYFAVGMSRIPISKHQTLLFYYQVKAEMSHMLVLKTLYTPWKQKSNLPF